MNNVCLVDNILNLADPVQHYFSSETTTNALQVVFLLLSGFSFLMLWATWLYEGNNVRLPAAIVIFYLIKMLSDMSLTLQPPSGLLWSSAISSSGLLKVTNLFVANVDPWVGNALLTFLFAFFLKNKTLKIIQMTLAIITMILVLIVLVFYQLSFSFAINSAILVSVFAFTYSYDLNAFYEKWNNGYQWVDEKKVVPLKKEELGRVQTEEIKVGSDSGNKNVELTPLPRN